MVDTNQDPVDLDTLSDEEIMNMSPEDINKLMGQEAVADEETQNSDEGSKEADNGVNVTENHSDPADSAADSDENAPGQQDDSGVSQEDSEIAKAEKANANPHSGESSEKSPEELAAEQADLELKAQETASQEQAKADSEKPKSETKTPKAEVTAEQLEHTAFFKQVTAPFKADGQDMQMRSANDVIRLMQMGVNYSRRMEEIKPLRAMAATMTKHGLDDPEKLAYLIDLGDGKPEAIQKLLKEKNIDPLDVDISKEVTYKGSNYSANPKDVDFEAAIKHTVSMPGGQQIVDDVVKLWDEESQGALRENPQIFDSLLEQSSSGVYEQIKTELNYQRTLGHLAGVPFLQAYHRVGDAMTKAGVFNSPKQDNSNGLAPLKAKPAPIDNGPRKAAAKPETVQPNPNLSASPKNSSLNRGEEVTPDYSSLSDEDFLKLGIPG